MSPKPPSLESLRRYVRTNGDWREGVWNRWLVSYLTPRGERSSDASIRDSSIEPESPISKGSVSKHDEANLVEADDERAPEVERRRLVASNRLDELTNHVLGLGDRVDAMLDHAKIEGRFERRRATRTLQLMEHVASLMDRQMAAVELLVSKLERVEQRIGFLDRGLDEELAEEEEAMRSALVERQSQRPSRPASFGSRPPGARRSAPPPEGTEEVVDELSSLSKDPSVSGSLADVSLPTILSMFELERRTGRLLLSFGEAGEIGFELLDGVIVGCKVDDAEEDPVNTLQQALRWPEGHFSFRQESVAMRDTPSWPVGSLLLEATRRSDEAVR